MPPIVEAVGLAKHYGDVHALDGLDLVAESGRVTALLGPNGAGKTTFISAVATLVKPTSGELRVAGIDAQARPKLVRQVIGLAGQSASVEPAMTGRENIEMVARLFGLDRVTAKRKTSEALELLNLDRRRPIGSSAPTPAACSDGSTSAPASWAQPRLLLLDEPTTGLDPRSRAELWEGIRNLVASGTDVLLTTQYLEEADQLARDIVIVDHGRVIASGTPDQLKTQGGRDVIEVHPQHAADLDGGGRGAGIGRGRAAPHRPRHPPRRRPDRRRRRPAGDGRPPARRPPDRRRRHRPAPPDPRRGLPRPDRSADRRRHRPRPRRHGRLRRER